MPSLEINWLAVLAAVIAMQAIGAAWYAPPVFGRAWMASIGLSPDRLGSPLKAMTAGIALSVVFCLAMALLVRWTGAADAAEAVALGLLVGIGICASMVATNAAYESRPPRYVLINAGHYLVDAVVVSLILTLWT
jgi:hypothetical protein